MIVVLEKVCCDILETKTFKFARPLPLNVLTFLVSIHPSEWQCLAA